MEKIRRNKEIVKDFKEIGVYTEVSRKHGISVSTVRQILNRKLTQEQQGEIKRAKMRRKRREALERKRMLTDEQRERKLRYMREYNKTYVRPDRRDNDLTSNF